MNGGWLLITVLCLVVATTPPALAEPAPGFADLEWMASRSQLVVVARCTDQSSRWDDPGRRIHTYTTFEVEQVVKGPSGIERVRLKELGGTVGRITQTLVGGPVFRPGERSLLFLIATDEPGSFRTFGLDRGTLAVTPDPATGRDLVRRNGSEGTLRGSPATGPTSPRPASGQTLELRTVVGAIARAAAQAEGP